MHHAAMTTVHEVSTSGLFPWFPSTRHEADRRRAPHISCSPYLLLLQAVALAIEDHNARAPSGRAESASDAGYHSVFEESPLPMWIFDLETAKLVAANTAAEDAYRFAPGEMAGLALSTFFLPEDLPTVERRLHELRENGAATKTSTCRHRRKDGTLMEVEVSSRKTTFAGRPACLAILQDISGRRRLEARVAQSQKLEAVGRLAGGVAHDFNNLLTAIQGYCDLLSTRLDTGHAAQEEVAEIRYAAERAAQLTQQLMAFSRQQVVQRKPLELGAAVRDVRRLMERLLGENIRVETSIAEALPPVLADPVQLQQSLLNLCLNARDAMPAGGSLRMTARRLTPEGDPSSPFHALPAGDYLLLGISDSGQGMSPEVQRRAFEPFFTTKPQGKGTGLGLASVYGIVQQSGGAIRIRSEVGEGTTVEIALPVAPAGIESGAGEEPVAEPSAGIEAPPGPSATTGTRGKVLLVEDDAPVAHVAMAMLERAGYTVALARSGGEALARAREHAGSLDLLVTDVVMPDLSGPELAERLQREMPGLPVLFVSGYTGDLLRRHGVDEGSAHFLQKPFVSASLARAVASALAR